MARKRRNRRRRVEHPDRAVIEFLRGKLPFNVREQDAIAAIKHGATLEIRPGKLTDKLAWTVQYPSGGHIYTSWDSFDTVQDVIERLCHLIDEWLPDVPRVVATRVTVDRTASGGLRTVEQRYTLRDNARQLELINSPEDNV